MTTGTQKFCPKCGDSCSPGAKFCGSCGYRFEEKGAVEVVRDVKQKVQKVESAVRTAESAVHTISKVQDLVISPPAEWKVVIGDKLPEALVEKTAGAVQARATDMIAEEDHKTVEKVVSTAVKNLETPSPARSSPGPGLEAGRCSSCGAIIKAGARYCGSCGAAYTPISKEETTPRTVIDPSPTCPKCGKPVKAGAKFCGSCGWKLG